MNDLIPVTLITGFLGSGKTTLVNRILSEAHGQKIAVIENEFGEANIDHELLVRERVEVVEMNNGCLCCSVRGDLIRILGDLAARRDAGELAFDRVLIETTGLADPAPVAQTFFADEAVHARYLLDALITVVDARHAMQQLDEHDAAQEQVGFADRLLVSKRDLVDDAAYAELIARLRQMNPRVPIVPMHFGDAPLSQLFDIKGFNLDAILEIEPDFLSGAHAHQHDDAISAFVYRSARAFDEAKLEIFFQCMIALFANDMLRYKGILHLAHETHVVTLQGIHMIVGGDRIRPWTVDEPRASTLVFIGRKLPEAVFKDGLDACLV